MLLQQSLTPLSLPAYRTLQGTAGKQASPTPTENTPPSIRKLIVLATPLSKTEVGQIVRK